MNGGRIGDKAVLPANWVSDAGSSKVIGGKKVDYGYMWWIPEAPDPVHKDAFYASGIFGQAIYINPQEKLVIALWSARPKPTGMDTIDDEDFFGAVAKALK